jgi:hypothetical protein
MLLKIVGEIFDESDSKVQELAEKNRRMEFFDCFINMSLDFLQPFSLAQLWKTLEQLHL